jgi:peptidoglycan/LPS O-acetylase OafA/YrhL
MKPLHLAGLNGIRAIAALAVVVSHITLGLSEFRLDPSVLGTFNGKPKGLDLAGFGVSIFFVLSGFLITYLLLVEKDKQPIDVKKFYLRRILRIWPIYYLYLAVVFGLTVFYALPHPPQYFGFYVFFMANIPAILGTPLPFLGHYWSLAGEEQFYAFWVWVVKKVENNLNFVVLGAFLGFFGLKTVLHFVYPNSIFETIIHITRFQCMFLGALGAILYKAKNVLFLKVFDTKIAQLLAWSVIGLLAINKYRFASILDQEFISVVTVALIIGQINVKNRLFNLENAVFDFLGKLSYGIYIWHPLVILGFSKVLSDLVLPNGLKYGIVYFSIILTTIGLAYLSFQYFEKYFLRMKERFSVVTSSATTPSVF